MSHILAEHDHARLIKSLKAQRTMFEVALEQIETPELYTRHGVLGVWSVKDIVAHVTVWDQRGTRWLEAYRCNEPFVMPEAGYTWADLDALNARTYAEHRHDRLEDVLRAFEEAFPPLLAAAESLTQAQINRPLTYHDGRQWQTVHGGKLIVWRYQHYREHAAHIKAWLSSLREGSVVKYG
ncbi:MAG: ClbS/DfsB family four-helix bundle protein [Aggregatilineales bacterium]